MNDTDQILIRTVVATMPPGMDEFDALREARNRIRSISRVYFVQCETPDGNGPIKIGYAECVSRRIKDLQSANPFPLRVLLSCKGGQVLEQALHQKFAADRIRGEWFRPSEQLCSFIKELLDDRLWRAGAL